MDETKRFIEFLKQGKETRKPNEKAIEIVLFWESAEKLIAEYEAQP